VGVVVVVAVVGGWVGGKRGWRREGRGGEWWVQGPQSTKPATLPAALAVRLSQFMPVKASCGRGHVRGKGGERGKEGRRGDEVREGRAEEGGDSSSHCYKQIQKKSLLCATRAPPG
jgi:hypothetical protein